MACNLEILQSDLRNLSPREFYIKHLRRTEVWYFEKILQIPPEQRASFFDDFKLIISDSLKIDISNIALVGSAKIGYSLSPTKLFSEFNNDSSIRKVSDIDVAIISPDLFDNYWNLLRNSYRPIYQSHYSAENIPTNIYRGFINEKFLQEIEGCRKKWKNFSDISKKLLHANLYIQHEVTYRLYRDWKDLEDYQVSSIYKIKKGLN